MPDTAPVEGATVNPGVRHERSDANVRYIFWFAALAGVLAILVHVGLAFFVWGMKAGEDRDKPPLPDIISEERQERSGELVPSLSEDERDGAGEIASRRREGRPRLQSDPVADLEMTRAWEDGEVARGRIPIDKALDLLADRAKARKLGVTSRAAPPAKRPASGAANSGRLERRSE